jgi:hypothetical protein
MRMPRLDFPGARHHVMNRGARCERIFLDDNDRRAMLDLLADLPERFGVRVHGYDVDGLVAGHTHVQLVRRDGPHTFVNVGTTSQPFARPYDGKPPQVLPFCDYAIIDASADTIDHGQGARRVARIDVSLRRLSFPFSAFAAELRATSFPHQDAWLAQWARSSSPG